MHANLPSEFSNKDLKSVGNYTLGRLIGKGSFGKVYLATHKLTNGSKVVLKSAKKDDSNLAREIHHHRQFVHPHIARLYEVIVTETMVWLVLEYCQGDELYNHLLKHGKLPLDKAQRIFTQLVGAVSYVHMQSCVHRDLKLENILLDKHENVKLVDFGFTREYEGKANYLQTFCGTICYSAPEMLKGERYAGEKVDVWSLGVILYALLCGELPFDDDDDDVTRRTILADEPKYPDHIPPDALSLLKSMLSKRPLLRPTLPDILSHPFLADYAPQQQAILKLQQPSPFSTPVEKDTLQRMRSSGVDIDNVIESVLAQRCDALSGWWTLLIEKEQRKLARRDRKRKEKELEHRNSRRLSTTSSRLERLATVDEAGSMYVIGEPSTPKSRGRTQRRSGHYDNLRIDDFPGLSELGRVNEAFRVANADHRPPPIDKDSLRSASSSRQRRPIPPPKEGLLRSARSRGSTLHLVTTSDALAAAGSMSAIANGNLAGSPSQAGIRNQKVRKKTSQAIITHWKNMTHWIAESTRRNKSAGKRGSQSTPNLVAPSVGGSSSKDGKDSKDGSPRPQTSKYPASVPGGSGSNTASLPRGVVANGYAPRPTGNGNGAGGLTASGGGLLVAGSSGGGGGSGIGSGSTVNSPLSTNLSSATTPSNYQFFQQQQTQQQTQPLQPTQAQTPAPPRLQTSNAYKRQSLSPSPLTPRSTVRRPSASHGLRGRKSTSSSVSSIRSIHHHHHSHSKASSTSSNGSVSTSMSKSTLPAGRSPHHSVKVLPATPTTTSFPSNLRLVRGGGLSAGSASNAFNEGLPLGRTPGSPNPFGTLHHGGGPGTPVMFAKRKRNIFKGPMLSFGGSGGGGSGGGGGGSSSGAVGGASRSRSGSGGTHSHSHSRSASATGLGRRSGEITIEEEDEDEMMEEEEMGQFMLDGDIEEVEAFSPIIQRPGERVEEIYEDAVDEEGGAGGADGAGDEALGETAESNGSSGKGKGKAPAIGGETIPAA